VLPIYTGFRTRPFESPTQLLALCAPLDFVLSGRLLAGLEAADVVGVDDVHIEDAPAPIQYPVCRAVTDATH
jgi:hypothetical protein